MGWSSCLFSLHSAGILSAVNLCTSCVYNAGLCEFVCVLSLLCLEEDVSTSSSSYDLSVSSSAQFLASWVEGFNKDHPISTECTKISQSLPLCSFVGFCVNYSTAQRNFSDDKRHTLIYENTNMSTLNFIFPNQRKKKEKKKIYVKLTLF